MSTNCEKLFVVSTNKENDLKADKEVEIYALKKYFLFPMGRNYEPLEECNGWLTAEVRAMIFKK